jgi:ABC-2 type transport system permease protein
VAWPVEAIPPLLHAVSFIFPSTSAIDGLVRINQMDATLADASADWLRLWILTAVYLAMAIAARKLFVRGGPADARAAA